MGLASWGADKPLTGLAFWSDRSAGQAMGWPGNVWRDGDCQARCQPSALRPAFYAGSTDAITQALPGGSGIKKKSTCTAASRPLAS